MQLNEFTRSEARVFGRYGLECLTPVADKLDEFVPLWDRRNAAIEERSALEARLEELRATDYDRVRWWELRLRREAKRARGEVAEILTAKGPLALEIAALSDRMRPLQYERFREEFNNLVTTVGKNDMLDKYLRGSAYTQTLVMLLCGTGTKAAGDTQASHGGWSEVGGTNAPAYTGNRPAITMGSAAAGVSTSPSTSFAITSSGTVAGCGMNNGGSATKDNTTGILFSAGDFTGGSQAVNNLDTLNVVYTLTLS